VKITLAKENTKLARIVASEGDELPARMKYAPHEQDAIRIQKMRLGKRAAIGKDWDGKADNDNIAWPLATSLIREGNTELLKAAMAYRKIHDTAKSKALLGGKSAAIGGNIAIDRYAYIKPNGAVVYKHPRQKKSADVDIPAKQYTVPPQYDQIDAGSEAIKVSNWTNIPKPWNGDKPVNDMLDAQGRLDGLRARLGILVEPLEMAVIDGATYQAVGNSLGVANRAGAMGAGCAAVHMGLVVVRDALGKIDRKDLAAA
jgi:hypothetical protein